MATMPRYPSLFQINTRVWLQRLSREAGKAITLADIDDATLDGFAAKGFDWIWLLSVWQIGAAGRAVSRGNPQWRAEFQALLPDLTEFPKLVEKQGVVPRILDNPPLIFHPTAEQTPGLVAGYSEGFAMYRESLPEYVRTQPNRPPLGRYGGINEDFVLVDGWGECEADGSQEMVESVGKALI
jgi:hypothetical protein